MFIAEKVGKEWTMDQASQYAIDHVANSKKNILEFDLPPKVRSLSFFGGGGPWGCLVQKLERKLMQRKLDMSRKSIVSYPSKNALELFWSCVRARL